MKLLKINEDRLMRSDIFAVLVSLLTAAFVLLPLFMSAKSKDNDNVKGLKIEDSLSFRYLTCTRAAIVYTSHEAGNYSLSIETKDGQEVLYNEYVRAMGKTARVFDFINLEDGAYKVVAKKNGKRIERAFTIKEGELRYTGRVTIDPIFKANGTHAIIELPNEQGKKVFVKVLDSKGEVLYSSVEENEVRKNFEFSKVDAGEYTVLVDIDGDDYHFGYTKE